MTARKMTEFAKIPQFTKPGQYAVDYGFTYLIDFVDEEIATAGLVMEPDFQRGHVWTERQQAAYVEFLLRGGLTGRDLYFNNPGWNQPVGPGEYADYVCVDGLQRITAIRRFVENDIKVFGSFFNEYTDKRRLGLNTIRVHINDLKTKDEVLRWYLEMNSGGTPHTKRELARVKNLLSAKRQEDENND